ncbi:unnamed protein product [Brachionus calyciflorus]|uniref:RRM domain-containing protein n=1 Tax=Brachionus calyciflorus TaxID=104777 RepID=A0A813PHI2_9BILA|nr:unnamed protein product [Brachionus calyciflorus]
MSRYRSGPSSTLYIRNISDRVRYDDLKRLFSKYGRVLDITIPLDYYSGMPKGFCFIEFDDARDAEEAQYQMDRQRLFGREIEVEFARGIRKTPGEMKTRDRGSKSSRRDYDRRDDRRSRSRSGDRGRDRKRARSKSRSRSRSRSKEERSRSRRSRTRSYSKNRTPSPKNKSVSKDRSVSRSRSTSPKRSERSTKSNGNMSRSPSPSS